MKNSELPQNRLCFSVGNHHLWITHFIFFLCSIFNPMDSIQTFHLYWN